VQATVKIHTPWQAYRRKCAHVFSALVFVAALIAWEGTAGASAHAFKLSLESNGEQVQPGTSAEIMLAVTAGAGFCRLQAASTVKTNGVHKDQVPPSGGTSSVCEIGDEAEGTMTKFEFIGGSCSGGFCERRDGGLVEVQFNPKLALTVPGPCRYEANKLIGIYAEPLPGEFVELEGKGKLNKAMSAHTCTQHVVVHGNGTAVDLQTGLLFEGHES
jgi:hypothetical protein